jgi:GTP-binding protein
VRLADLPDTRFPEVAFIGRSNVGKSSLINALTGRRGLARVSNTPGRTQEINFFLLDMRLMIADLPGYGYAKAPKAMAQSWQDLMKRYLAGRTQLARVFLLGDARHGLKPNDEEMMALLDRAAQSYHVVLTKADKLSGPEQAQAMAKAQAAAAKHVAAHPDLFLTSSETGFGIEALQDLIGELAL